MVAQKTRLLVFLAGLGLLLGGLAVGQFTGGLHAQGTAPAQAGGAGDRAADREAIRQAMKDFIAAFERGDAAAVAAHMTTGAELTPPDGTTVRGRDAIQKRYVEYLAKNPKHSVKVEPDSLHFLSRDTALGEGHMTVTTGKGDPGVNRYVILHVREDGKWLIAVLRNDESEQATLRDLEWLIGTWETKGTEAQARTTYQWVGNKAFIRSEFTVREKDTAVTGTQMIGLDPNTDELRTWTFEADGGYGEGTVTRDGNKWLFRSTATLSDGSEMTATNILMPIDRDTFTWQPVDLTVDGEAVGNLPPVKVSRVKDK
jgi:uncharacterized protein (TIGR02246 family)